MSYDFTRLTAKQQELLTSQGWTLKDGPGVQPSPRQVERLLQRGLVVKRMRADNAFSWREYIVPIPVHMAWCAHCAADRSQE